MKCLLTILLLIAPPVFAVDTTHLFATIAERQRSLDNYVVDLEVSLFADGAMTAEQMFPARTVRLGPAMLQEFASYVMLQRPDIRLVVDRAARTIHLNPVKHSVHSDIALDPAAVFARAREAGYEMGLEDRADQVTMRFTAVSRPSFTLIFDRTDLRLRRMEMSGASNQAHGPGRTVVAYTWHDVREVPAQRLEGHYYVRRTDAGWEPAPAFEGYRVVVSRER